MTSHVGDWVEVRSKEEILRTLDKNGRLNGVPFMPEMLAFCGKRLRVHKSAHKLCDTINPHSSRSLPGAVLLEGVRCDGAAHGGCQAQCSVFWKTEWLKPAEGVAPAVADSGAGCTEADLAAATQAPEKHNGKIAYRCQTTDLPEYTTKLRTRNFKQYADDLTSGNESLLPMLMTAAYFAYDMIFKPGSNTERGAAARDFYDNVVRLWGGVPYPRRRGELDPKDAPVQALDLKPGELVRVKSYEEILKTLDTTNNNRGLYFDAEMVPYCGGVFRVRSRIDQFLDEWTGVMRKMRTPAVILDGVWCRSRFSNYRAFCPRAIYAWWREGWLERAEEGAEISTASCLGAKALLGKEAAHDAHEGDARTAEAHRSEAAA